MQRSSPTNTFGIVAVHPGESWPFQGWHRDAAEGVATPNFTGRLTVASR